MPLQHPVAAAAEVVTGHPNRSRTPRRNGHVGTTAVCRLTTCVTLPPQHTARQRRCGRNVRETPVYAHEATDVVPHTHTHAWRALFSPPTATTITTVPPATARSAVTVESTIRPTCRHRSFETCAAVVLPLPVVRPYVIHACAYVSVCP